MVQFIVGEKGKGKTKILLEKVNSEVLKSEGNIVYLDKSTKHMYELNNKVRLIDVSSFGLDNFDQFIGFILGILSQDHDLLQMYFDSFLKIASADASNLSPVIAKLEKISAEYKVDFILSVSADESVIPAEYKSGIIVAL